MVGRPQDGYDLVVSILLVFTNHLGGGGRRGGVGGGALGGLDQLVRLLFYRIHIFTMSKQYLKILAIILCCENTKRA